MKAVKIILTDPKFCCEKCRSNAVEIVCSVDDIYEVRGCPICHERVYGLPDEDHFWKIGEFINQALRDR